MFDFPSNPVTMNTKKWYPEIFDFQKIFKGVSFDFQKESLSEASLTQYIMTQIASIYLVQDFIRRRKTQRQV